MKRAGRPKSTEGTDLVTFCRKRKLNELLNSSLELPVLSGSYIYFLFKDLELVYVGQSKFLHGRITDHLKGREKKDFNRVSYLPISENINCIEEAFIWHFKPKYNVKIKPIWNGNILREALKLINTETLPKEAS